VAEAPEREPALPASLGRRFFGALDESLGLRSSTYPVPEYANKLAYSLGGLSLVAFL
jgi:ubiquinol-cytochrome c reductase cytochrome b subunit